MNYRKYFLMFLFSLSSMTFSQSGNLKFDFDYASFKGYDGFSKIEFYYSFFQPSMKILSRENQIVTSAYLNLMVLDEQNQTVFSKGGEFESVFDTASSEKNLIGQLNFVLKPGNYKLNIIAKDNFDTTSNFKTTIDFNVKNFVSTQLNLSDLQLAGKIFKSSDSLSVFYKNTLEVEPNPTKVFSMNSPVVYYYSEIYNASRDVTTQYKITNAMGEIKLSKSKKFFTNQNAIVDIGALPISNLSSGVYSLSVNASDGRQNIELLKKFYVYNPSKMDTIINTAVNADLVMQSEFMSLSEEELNLIFRKSEYIASENEKKDWKKLTNEEGKRKYLFNFWQIRDEYPETPINETKISYFERVDYAQSKFAGLSNKEGWRTDRGRVYIVYGKPSEIERYPNESETKPHEVWHYESLEGGVEFVFADLSGYSDYQLIHSTKRGELSLPNWEEKIKQ